ncbi:MAG: beta-ketoacyl-[acyl-carrier-protein] synthase family protein [Nitrospiraceae bacterium]|nr:beta-ketoacyl-[acyl-carrier-protein] synthase family protein [Nitrospiraceae bacterium]
MSLGLSKKRRVVVTGLGLATSLGLDLRKNWEQALAGISGVRTLGNPGWSRSPVQAVGEVSAADLKVIQQTYAKEAADEGERRTLFALWAAGSALADAGLPKGAPDGDRCGVSLAAGLGVNRLEDIQRWLTAEKSFEYERFSRESGKVSDDSIIRNNSNRPASLIAGRFGLHGFNSTVTTACASATQAIGIGFRAVQRGDADLIVAGGADSMINPVGLIFFVLLGAAAVSREDPATVCRPFDRKRSGLVMGEGAGFAVLEEESHAIARSARIYAEVCGYGSSMDAYQVTAPHPKGAGAEISMRRALQDASVGAEGIDYINAHGTSTKLNDAAETTAIKAVFGAQAPKIAISSSKSLIGHLLAASGGPEFAFTVMSVRHDAIHPTINLTNRDPKCDLDYVPGEKRMKKVRAALSNSFGFGGQNASIILKKYQ